MGGAVFLFIYLRGNLIRFSFQREKAQPPKEGQKATPPRRKERGRKHHHAQNQKKSRKRKQHHLRGRCVVPYAWCSAASMSRHFLSGPVVFPILLCVCEVLPSPPPFGAAAVPPVSLKSAVYLPSSPFLGAVLSPPLRLCRFFVGGPAHLSSLFLVVLSCHPFGKCVFRVSH